MKYLMPLALILVLGCTNVMRAEHTTTELDQLPGRSDPVRVACRDQSEVIASATIPQFIPTFRAGFYGTIDTVHGPPCITTSASAARRRR